ncbi:MAG: four helix bundle protein [Phycisphaeraceae bacterium]|nr:four helix bundle protein [Phycisphaeraceae bacterium]
MNEIRSHRDLIAWQKAITFGLNVYDATEAFPNSERFGLTSQLRRAAVSVASNIAEGYGRGTTPDYLRFLRAARGSLYELDTQLLFAARRAYIDERTHASLLEQLTECSRVLAGLIRSLED